MSMLLSAGQVADLINKYGDLSPATRVEVMKRGVGSTIFEGKFRGMGTEYIDFGDNVWTMRVGIDQAFVAVFCRETDNLVQLIYPTTAPV